MEEKIVLAMYDVRGKQNFIYKSRKCKEIVGGTHVIADVFRDYLYPAAQECGESAKGLYDYTQNGEAEEFSVEAFKQRLKDGYAGEVVYEGGGNFLVLYKNASVCTKINRIFSRRLLQKVDTLKVLCTQLEIDDFSDFKEDRNRLYEQHRINEQQESVGCAVNTLPFIQVEPESGRPFTGMVVKTGGMAPEKVTAEQKAKYEKYDQYLRTLKDENKYDQEAFLLDSLVTEKGKESLLAVVYIDGNGMGAKVQQCLADLKSYEECVSRLRRFSAEIDKEYVKDRIKDINSCLEEKYRDNPKKVRRTIVTAGDEMTIICNARDAMDVVKTYFANLKSGSSCAGIAIFHSHAPYSDAYRIAEECCENGKALMKKEQIENANLVDFHYCQGGIGISLESIRRKEGVSELTSKPWRMDTTYRLVEEMAAILGKLGRSNVKTLRQASKEGEAELLMEMERINAHQQKAEKPIDFLLGGKIESKEDMRKMIYDITMVYDLWFQEDKGDKE